MSEKGTTSSLDDEILSYLRSRSEAQVDVTRKEMVKHLKSIANNSAINGSSKRKRRSSSTTAWNKKDIMRALKGLVRLALEATDDRAGIKISNERIFSVQDEPSPDGGVCRSIHKEVNDDCNHDQ